MSEKDIIKYLNSAIKYHYTGCLSPTNSELGRLQRKELKALKVAKNYIKENQQLKEKLKKYEDPEDMTLMFIWCEEQAKDKIKELQQENQQLKEQLQRKYDNFPKSVKYLSREQLESLYLDLLHVEHEKNQQLQQKDEVIDEVIKFIKDNKSYEYESEESSYLDHEALNELLGILSKGRCSHEN